MKRSECYEIKANCKVFGDHTTGRCKDIIIQGYTNHCCEPPRSTYQCGDHRHSEGMHRPDIQRPNRAQCWICPVHDKDQRDTKEIKG